MIARPANPKLDTAQRHREDGEHGQPAEDAHLEDEREVSVVRRHADLVAARPDLLVVHLPQVDLTGHVKQWMSPEYLEAVRRADAAVGRIVAALPADTTIILTADHGGHGDGHSAGNSQDSTIPWVIAGPSTARGKQLTSGISTMDTAATAAFVLGVALQPTAQGLPVYDAFVSR